ncbi:hypothetical protein DY000_02021126 [Brassica cretica]|uniref:Retrotransposon gag domain-containing protein n=1 Tax=Brassica cretica TaxID=69181 RepID=A0ABQ7E3E2_BRACR|nr:hypothetical protein DY000_02021126 [Brassica cretica]
MNYPKLPKERPNSRGKSMVCRVNLKEKLNEHSKQLEQSAEKLGQLESENLNLRDENQALNTASNKKRRFRAQVRPMPTLETPNSGTDANLPPTASGGDTSTPPDGATKAESPMVVYLEQMFTKRLYAMQSMVERLPGVAPPIRKSNPNSYADTPFTDEITLIEMPRKLSIPSIKAYDGTTDPDDHIAQYRQKMLAVALQKGSREATMCKGFGSTLTGPALQWYINLPSRSIASFAVLSDKFVEQFARSMVLEKTSDSLYEILQHRAEPLRGYIARFNQEKVAIPECSISTAISAFKRGLLPDGDLYKELTKYQCKTMEDVLSRAWAQRDEKSSERPARDSGNQNRGRYQNWPIEKAEGMAVSTWPDISHLSVSRPELINVVRQMGQKVKWPQKMKAPDSFRNPGFWCDFHREHGHKMEDCVALKVEVNELLKKGHLREFLSEKAKSHLSKETMGKPTEAAPFSLPRQDRVIHVISGEAAKPKCLLLSTDEISFTAKEQEKVLTPHHDALVISLTVANCLVKRILVDNGSSGDIIFQAANKDLRLEESALTRMITPLIGFSGEVKQTAREVTLTVYAEGINMSTKFLVVDCDSSYNMILGRP